MGQKCPFLDRKVEHSVMMTVVPEQFVGQTIGHYQAEMLLYQDRMSAVYRAQQLLNHMPVQLTIFFPPGTLTARLHQQFLTRFMHEAAKLQATRHPHLLPIYIYGERGGFPYLVTPAFSQRSAAILLQQQGRCAPALALPILEQIVNGLEYAHRQGVIHRALNPAFIFVHEDQRVQVAGLGLMNLLEKRGMVEDDRPFAYLYTIADTLLTPPRYLAPECLEGQRGDVRSDVYSLGAILFEMISALPLFSGDLSSASLSQRRNPPPMLHERYSDVPPALDRVLQQTLAYDPDRRFQRAGDFLVAVQQAMQGSTTQIGKLYLSAGLSSTGQLNSFPMCNNCPVVHTGSCGTGADSGVINVAATGRSSHMETSGPLPTLWDTGISSRQIHSRRSRRVSRRRALAFGLTGAGIAIGLGVLGFEHANLAKLANRGMVQMPSSTSMGKSIIGHTSQTRNTALSFTNPRDGHASLLIRLPNGDFVAFERACTHQGVPVNYNEQTHMLVCPLHSSVFDPAHNGRVVQGPATTALPGVTIQDNTNGTITTD
jgi:serine/threonine protein kinase